MAHSEQPNDAAADAPPRHEPTRGLYGHVTHTELASADPNATKAWCQEVLGWTFMPSFPMEGGGEYHLFALTPSRLAAASDATIRPRCRAASRTSMSRTVRLRSTGPSKRVPKRCWHRSG